MNHCAAVVTRSNAQVVTAPELLLAGGKRRSRSLEKQKAIMDEVEDVDAAAGGAGKRGGRGGGNDSDSGDEYVEGSRRAKPAAKRKVLPKARPPRKPPTASPSASPTASATAATAGVEGTTGVEGTDVATADATEAAAGDAEPITGADFVVSFGATLHEQALASFGAVARDSFREATAVALGAAKAQVAIASAAAGSVVVAALVCGLVSAAEAEAKARRVGDVGAALQDAGLGKSDVAPPEVRRRNAADQAAIAGDGGALALPDLGQDGEARHKHW